MTLNKPCSKTLRRGHSRPAPGAMRIAQPLLRRTLKHQFAGYCETLKQVLENQTRIVR
jgi:hypothetical protein